MIAGAHFVASQVLWVFSFLECAIAVGLVHLMLWRERFNYNGRVNAGVIALEVLSSKKQYDYIL